MTTSLRRFGWVLPPQRGEVHMTTDTETRLLAARIQQLLAKLARNRTAETAATDQLDAGLDDILERRR